MRHQELTMRGQSLDSLLRPGSLAVIGASADVNKIGGRFMASFIRTGYTGRLYPVSLKADEIMGLKAYPSVLDIPDDVDLALLTVPAAVTEEAMRQCARKGVRFVVVHGTGFSEIGALGKDLEARVLEIARQGGVRVVGPNCMGLFCPHVRLNSIVARYDFPIAPGPIGFCGQSGWACENTVLLGTLRGLRFSGVISSGNQSDLNILDYLEYFGADPDTRVIGAYLEGVKDGPGLLERAREISRSKPIVIWKSGRSAAGARAVASHTASLAGSYRVTEAALKQAGVLCAGNLEELLDLLIAFRCPQLPKGRRVGILVESGGGGVCAADSCEPAGLEVPPLPREIRQEMIDFTTGKIPPASGMGNPVDIIWSPAQGGREFWLGCMEILLKAMDSIIVITYHDLSDDVFLEGILELMDRTSKPIILIPGHPTTQPEGMPKCVLRGIPVYATPERAVTALRAMARYAEQVKTSRGTS